MTVEARENMSSKVWIRLAFFVLAAVFVALLPSTSRAGTWIPFGPQTYVRGTGAPALVTSRFSVQNPNAVYTLLIRNGGLNGSQAKSVGVITLNGTQIVGPLDLNLRMALVQLPVRLLANNQIGVQLQGATGSAITVEIQGEDNGAPVISGIISPAPNALGWNNSNVTVNFTCADKISGVAVCPPPVVVTTDGARQIVSGTAIDNAGNIARTSVVVNLDKTAPTINGQISPAPNSAGWNLANARVIFNCSDQTSGVILCPAPVKLTAAGADQIIAGTARDIAGNVSTTRVSVSIATPVFKIQSYRGKCLDFGAEPYAGAPVFIQDCNGSAEQQILVQEIDSQHDVLLHAGSFVVGVHDPQLTSAGPAGPPPTQYALELQKPANLAFLNSRTQKFSLDGDSIIYAFNRNFVFQPQNGRGANGTPLIAGPRNLADSEFWDFIATDHSDIDPTSGFVRVSTRDDLLIAMYQINQIAKLNNGAAWGSVIKIQDTGEAIDLTPNPAYIDGNDGSYHNLVIPTGVTIRSDRRDTLLGALLSGNYTNTNEMPDGLPPHMMDIEGNYVRITGLRLQGPTDSNAENIPQADGIHIGNTNIKSELSGVLIDHNNVSQWPLAAIQPYGGQEDTFCNSGRRIGPLDSVHVSRNFIHNNEASGLGYGVVMSDDAGASVLGNTFLLNRHAIAADGNTGDQYTAQNNLVLTNVPAYGTLGHLQQDFDMHGTLSEPGCLWYTLFVDCPDQQHDGGFAGNFVEIAWNTFLGGDRINYTLRGQPCSTNTFYDNATQQSSGSTIEEWDSAGNSSNPTSTTTDLVIALNQFGDSSPAYADPTTQFGTGDFDGDGRQDLFLATGTSWFYSPGGIAEWRYLAGGRTDRLSSLLLGDLDGDGRTDVIGKNGNNVMVSWAGTSDWQAVNSTPAGISDLAIGDFDGDGRADIFWADGTSWYVSYGGTSPFQFVNTSSKLVQEMRFGHFPVCGSGKETDVFAIVAGAWQVTCGALSDWVPLPVTLTNSVDGLTVADFDGDGNSDIAMNAAANGNLNVAPTSGNGWMISYSGAANWQQYPVSATDECAPSNPQLPSATLVTSVSAIANFDGSPGADVLLWNGQFTNRLCIASKGTTALHLYSRYDMR